MAAAYSSSSEDESYEPVTYQVPDHLQLLVTKLVKDVKGQLLTIFPPTNVTKKGEVNKYVRDFCQGREGVTRPAKCLLLSGVDAKTWILPSVLHSFPNLDVTTLGPDMTLANIDEIFEDAAAGGTGFVVINDIDKVYRNSKDVDQESLVRELTKMRFSHLCIVGTTDVLLYLVTNEVSDLFRAERIVIPITSLPARRELFFALVMQ
jgi:hypothetical protein